jgi:hypothetical protein
MIHLNIYNTKYVNFKLERKKSVILTQTFDENEL